MAIIQWILGIRPVFDGLQVAPVIPRAWSGFEVMRVFRGATCHFSIECAGQGSDVSLKVDGRPLPGNIIPLPENDQHEAWAKAVPIWAGNLRVTNTVPAAASLRGGMPGADEPRRGKYQ